MSRSKISKARFYAVATPHGYRLRREVEREPRTSELEAVARASQLRQRAAEYEREGGHGNKRPVTVLTKGVQNRLRWTLTKIDWWKLDNPDWRLAMVTLTMPADWRAVCPDGRTFKAQLRRFESRWRRRWGALVGIYVVEFQPRDGQPPEQRNAPHIHMVVQVPRSVRLERDDSDHTGRETWDWALAAWGDIVNANDGGAHRRRGVDVRWVEMGRGIGSHVQRISDYLAWEVGKTRQKEAPEGFGTFGQWWGKWGVELVEQEREITRDEHFAQRRVLRKIRKRTNRGRDPQAPRGHDGLAVYGVDGRKYGWRLADWWLDIAPEP